MSFWRLRMALSMTSSLKLVSTKSSLRKTAPWLSTNIINPSVCGRGLLYQQRAYMNHSHEDEGFECIDEHAQTLKHEQELKQTISKLSAEQALLRKELQLKDSFKTMLEAEKKTMRDQIGRLENYGDTLQKSLGRLAETDKGTQQQVRNLTACNATLNGIKDSLNTLSKSISQKLEASKSGEREIIEEMKKTYKEVKDEMANLYQQIIDQKNKQIKSLKAKLEEQKKAADTVEIANTILQKTTQMEENTRVIMNFVNQLQSKDKEIAELKARALQLEKSLAAKDAETAKLMEDTRLISHQLSFKNELLESFTKELTSKQLALTNSQARVDDMMTVIKNLQGNLREEQIKREKLEEQRLSSENLSYQMDTGFRQLSEKMELIEYQLSRNHELTELFEIFEQKVTDAIRNTKQNNLAFFFENIHERLLQTLPEQKSLLTTIRNDLRFIVDDVNSRKLSEQLKRYPPMQAEEQQRKSMFELARKKIDSSFDFFEV